MNSIPQILQQAMTLSHRGIHRDPVTGLQFYSGYEYKALYDWDQYFEGLVQAFLGMPSDYAENALHILLSRQNPDGFIPRVVRLERGQSPEVEEIHQLEQEECAKPFLAQLAIHIAHWRGGDFSFVSAEMLAGLDRFLTYWCDAGDPTKIGLSIWRSSIMAMDNQHERAGKWKADFCAGVDLNCYLIREMDSLAMLYENARGASARAAKWRSAAEARRVRLNELCWDDDRGFYYDYHIRTGERIPVVYIGGFAPLWARASSPAQATRLVKEHLKNPEEFFTPARIPTLAASEPGYSPVHLPGDIGCSWRANVWAPTNFYIQDGLKLYGFDKEAAELADHSADIVRRVGLREYYLSTDGSGCGLDPFWGWTILMLFMPTQSRLDFHPSLHIYRPANSDLWTGMSDSLTDGILSSTT